MEKFFSWYLWLIPLFIFFEYVLISQKKRYVLKNYSVDTSLNDNDDIDQNYKVGLIFALLVFLPLVIVSTNRDIGFGDTAAYADMFEGWPDKLTNINLTGKERYPGFIYFTVIVKQFFSDDYRVWFFIIAAIQCFCLAITYRKYSSEIVLCAYFFLMADFQSWMNNGIRQFLVVSIMFALIPLLLSKKVSKVFIFIVIGLLLYYTHVSIIIALPIYVISLGKPMNKRTVIILTLLVLAIVFVGQFTDLLSDTIENTNYSTSVSEITSTDNGTNIMRVLFFSLPAILCIVFRNKIPNDAPAIINYSINMSLVGAAFYWLSAFTNGISMGRIPIYFTLFNYILIPWEIRTFFKENNIKIVYTFFILIYFVFYIYQQSVWMA